MNDPGLTIIAVCFVITAIGTLALYLDDRKRHEKMDRIIDAAQEVIKDISEESSYYTELQKFIIDLTDGPR